MQKTDLVSKEQLVLLENSIKKLNPKAKIIQAVNAKIEPSEILNAKLFNYEEAEMSAGWIQELEGIHTPETEEYGINSFVFRDHRPFHPERLWNFIQDFPQSIIRSKGLFWIASRPKQALNWSQARGSIKAESAGVWWASMPFSERIKYASFIDNQEVIEERWSLDFGDRLNELVFIGINIDEYEIQKKIEDSLCNEDEIMDLLDGFFTNKDNFPIVNPSQNQKNTVDFFD